MDIQKLLAEIRLFLVDVFGEVDVWFDKPADCRSYRPKNGGWTVDEILEHICLTSRFLLILIEKGAEKALRAAHKFDLEKELANYTFHIDRLDEIGLHRSFAWMRPEHMEPTGERELSEVRAEIKSQVARCLDVLELLKNGEGILFKTTMTVNDLGKIDVYQYVYFLAQHGRRHLAQMAKNEAEFGSINR